MSVNLEYLCKDLEKHKVSLIAGHKGLSNKIRWAHMVESSEIATFLQGEEMIFTSGIGLNNEFDLLTLIKTTKEQNASGVILNVGKYITSIPESVIDYCNQNNYPLFIAPWDVRLADIMKNLTISIIESERTYLEIEDAIKNLLFLSSDNELYVSKLRKIGFKSDWKYVTAVIEVENPHNTLNNSEHSTLQVKNALEECLAVLRNYFFSVSVGDTIIILFYKKDLREIEELLKKIYIVLNKKFKDLNFYIGLGKHIHPLEELHKAFEESKNVAKINSILSNNNVRIRYSEFGLYKLLFSIESKEVLQEFHDETIGDLEIYDEINNTDYVDLLISYF